LDRVPALPVKLGANHIKLILSKFTNEEAE
jgi:hypothetical protein